MTSDSRPDPRAAAGMARRGTRGRRRAARDDARDGDAGRTAVGARRPLARDRRARSHVLHEPRRRARATSSAQNPRAAVAIHWWELGRQVRSRAPSRRSSEAESAAYWETRPRGSQIAALGVAAVAAARGRDRARRARRRGGGAIRGRRRSASAVLGRLPPRPRSDRVLDTPRRPAPRPRSLRPRGRRLAARAPGAVSATTAARARRPCTGPRRSRACSPSRRTAAQRRSGPEPRSSSYGTREAEVLHPRHDERVACREARARSVGAHARRSRRAPCSDPASPSSPGAEERRVRHRVHRVEVRRHPPRQLADAEVARRRQAEHGGRDADVVAARAGARA